MVRKVADEANEMAGRVDASGTVEPGRTWRLAGAAAAAIVLLGGFGVLRAGDMGPWFRRNVLFQNVEYPRQTYLTVVTDPPDRLVPRGGDLKLTVTADPDEVVPPSVIVHKRFPGLGGTEPQVLEPRELGGHIFETEWEGVVESFRFRVEGGDDRSGWFEVRVVDPPEIVKLHFNVDYPGYMVRASEPVKAEQGVLSLPPGTTITLAGSANEELSDVKLFLDDEQVGSAHRMKQPDGEGRERWRGIRGSLTLPNRIEESSLTLRVQVTGLGREGLAGVTNPSAAVYVLRVRPDRAPIVHLDREGVRGDISTRAMLPLVIQASDQVGIRGMQIKIDPTASVEGEPLRGTTGPAVTTRPAGKVVDVPDLPEDQREMTVDHVVDLEPMDLSVGQLVRVRAIVSDTLPESYGGPNRSESAVHTFKVVSDDELLQELIRRQKEYGEEFEKAVKLQGLARDRMRAVRDALTAGGAVGPEITRRVKAALAEQTRVAADVAVTAEHMQGIRDEMHYNRIGSPLQFEQLDVKIIGPLNRISKNPMKELIAAVSRASNVTDAGELREQSEQIADVMDGYYQELSAILEEMRKAESRQELIRWLTRIFEDAEQVQRIIDEQIEAERRELTGESTTRPAEPQP
jgi:hypothetical protein